MIVREPHPSDAYTLIHSEALADGRLTFKARGLLAYLLSLPPGTAISPERIAKSGTDGERAVKSGLKELDEFGYLNRVTITAEDGTESLHSSVTDTPGVVPSTPAPAPIKAEAVRLEPAGPRAWMPSDAALKTARDAIEIQDIPLSIAKYRIRMAELRKEPSASEWLRWLIEDEQKLRAAEREQARENGHKKSWFSVAGD